jgi:hypothetical protein
MAAGPARAAGRGRGTLENGTRLSRSARIVWNSDLRLHLDPQRVTPSSFQAFHDPHGCCDSNVPLSHGYGLRVSLGAGFRVQATRLRGLHLEPPRPRVPEERHERELHRPSPDGHPEPRTNAGLAFQQAAPGIPKPEWAELETRMEWPTLLSPWGTPETAAGAPSVRAPHRGPELVTRSHGAAQAALSATYPQPSKHSGRDRAHPRASLARLAGPPPAARAAAVPIGCVTDGVDSRPGAPPESRSSLEERFDAGWKNWSGGHGSWTVDAAGARTGSLALFTPSLEWQDYELEFFTRIENRSVTWVYRAAGLNDYYMAALTGLPGKGYAFTHRTVHRGKPGAASTAPVSILPNAKSAYLIRMRIAGNQFSVSIDGQLIETWTDTKLSTGGVGFMGAPEDRARIYWVRFYPGPAKEFPRK